MAQALVMCNPVQRQPFLARSLLAMLRSFQGRQVRLVISPIKHTLIRRFQQPWQVSFLMLEQLERIIKFLRIQKAV